MQSGTLGILPVCLLMITAVGLRNHVTVIDHLLEVSKRDAWLSVLFSVLPLIVWIFFLYLIMKKIGSRHFADWLQARVGKLPTYLVVCFLCAYLFLISTTTSIDLVTWTQLTYLPKTPIVVLAGSFLTLCFFATLHGVEVIAIVNGILLPFIVIFGFFVAFSNFQYKDYSYLFPIFEYGLGPTMKGLIYIGSGYVELLFLFILLVKLKKKITYIPLLITGLVLVQLTFGPTTGAIAEFGPEEAARQRFPAFEQWGLVSLGRIVEHVDFLSVYQWLSGAFVRISLYMSMIPLLLKLEGKKKTFLLLFLFILIVGITTLPFSDVTFQQLMFDHLLPWSFYIMFSFSILIGIVAFIPKKKGVATDGTNN